MCQYYLLQYQLGSLPPRYVPVLVKLELLTPVLPESGGQGDVGNGFLYYINGGPAITRCTPSS